MYKTPWKWTIYCLSVIKQLFPRLIMSHQALSRHCLFNIKYNDGCTFSHTIPSLKYLNICSCPSGISTLSEDIGNLYSSRSLSACSFNMMLPLHKSSLKYSLVLTCSVPLPASLKPKTRCWLIAFSRGAVMKISTVQWGKKRSSYKHRTHKHRGRCLKMPFFSKFKSGLPQFTWWGL